MGRIPRDIVITDEKQRREIYREGPYSQMSVASPLNAIMEEIERDGLQRFLQKRHMTESTTGPLSVATGRAGGFEALKLSTRYWYDRLRFWRKPPR